MSLAVFRSSSAKYPPVAFLKNTSPNLPMQESVDPSFYLYVEKLSLEKLRREERRLRAGPPASSVKMSAQFLTVGLNKTTNKEEPSSSETRFKLAVAKSEDIRWRTFVKLSYQKAKICARLVKGGSQHRNSLKSGAVLPSLSGQSSAVSSASCCPYKNPKSAMSLCDISTSSSVETSPSSDELSLEQPLPQQQQQQQQRRGRSRSDAFIVRPGHWRPDVNLFLSLSAPARLPSPVGLESSS